MKSWRRQKVGAGAGESPYCKARQIRSCRLLSGSTENLLLLPDDGVAFCACSRQVKHSLHLPCFYGRTLSSTVPAHHAENVQNFAANKNIGGCLNSLIFSKLCSLYLCLQASYQKVVNTQMLTITVQHNFLYSRPPNQRGVCAHQITVYTIPILLTCLYISVCRGGDFLLPNREKPSPRSLNSVKRCAV